MWKRHEGKYAVVELIQKTTRYMKDTTEKGDAVGQIILGLYIQKRRKEVGNNREETLQMNCSYFT